MNIILANLKKKNPKVHRANDKGFPLCGATHPPRINSDKMLHDSIRLKPTKPRNDIIEDIGEVSCKVCLDMMNGEYGTEAGARILLNRLGMREPQLRARPTTARAVEGSTPLGRAKTSNEVQ